MAVQQLREVLPHVHIALGNTAVELNLARGKTEALLVLHGANSKALRKQLYNDSSPCLDLLMPAGQKKRLCRTRQYTHLGGVVADSRSLATDLRQVTGEAERVFFRLKELCSETTTLLAMNGYIVLTVWWFCQRSNRRL